MLGVQGKCRSVLLAISISSAVALSGVATQALEASPADSPAPALCAPAAPVAVEPARSLRREQTPTPGPTLVTAQAGSLSGSTAVLRWNPVATETTPVYYQVRCGQTMQAAGTPVVSQPQAETELTLTGLQELPEKLFYWQVRMVDASGVPVSDWSEQGSFTVDRTAPTLEDTSLYTKNVFSGTQTIRTVVSADTASWKLRITPVGDPEKTTFETSDAAALFVSATLKNGSYMARYELRDHAGNTGTVQVPLTVVNVDETPLSQVATLSTIQASAQEVTRLREPSRSNQASQQVIADTIARDSSPASEREVFTADKTTEPKRSSGVVIQAGSRGWVILGVPWYGWLVGLGVIVGLGVYLYRKWRQ